MEYYTQSEINLLELEVAVYIPASVVTHLEVGYVKWIGDVASEVRPLMKVEAVVQT